METDSGVEWSLYMSPGNPVANTTNNMSRYAARNRALMFALYGDDELLHTRHDDECESPVCTNCTNGKAIYCEVCQIMPKGCKCAVCTPKEYECDVCNGTGEVTNN